MRIPFRKMHGAGNDFVVIDHRNAFLPGDPAALVARLCDRRRGVGADGVLLLENDAPNDFAMRYFNADGGAAEYCGNGARCLAALAIELGLGGIDGVVRFRTAAGLQRARRRADGRGIDVEFGTPIDAGEPCTVEACGQTFVGRTIRPGVPHFVTEVEPIDRVPIGEWGPALRQHPHFAPEGVNVDFVARLGPGHLALRTFERGVESETLACGSGAIAAAVWLATRVSVSEVAIVTAGGDELHVTLEPAGNRHRVTIGGPAETAFAGVWTEPAEVPTQSRG